MTQIPPYDLESEAAVLSACMLDPQALDKVAAILRPDRFYSEAHARVFEAAMGLHADGKPVDAVQVATWLRDNGRLSQIGGMAYLTEVLAAAPAVANVEAYANTVAEKWQLRQLILACQRIVAQGYGPVPDVRKFIDGAEQAVFDVAREASSRAQLHPLRDVVRERFQDWGDYWKKIETGEIRPGEVSGLSTGLSRLDSMTGGLQDGTLVIVAARPGMGKSSLAYCLAEHVATMPGKAGEPVRPNVAAMFSLEMPEEEIADRAICSEALVDLRKTRTAMFDRRDWSKLTTAAVALGKLDQLYIDDSPGLTMTRIRAMARELAAKLVREGRRLRLVAVDYLQLVESDAGSDSRESREQAVAKVSRGLKGLAKELSLPVVALAQLNRGVELRSDKRPLMSDLRESGAIEQDADLILFIYRDEYYNAESQDRGIAEIIVAKQRSGGPTGIIKVRFDAVYTRFSNLPEEHDEHG